MFTDWNQVTEDLQIALSREALHRAVSIIVTQAEALAHEIERGGLRDRGGPEALRLFAAVLSVSDSDELVPAGHC
jgi:hypothetical protein